MSATSLARDVVDRLEAAGVTELVLCPGSRNAPLAFAAYDAAAGGRMRLHTRIDERTAGFLALGLSKVGARAAVMCTSGTAVANLHPAVLEAAHAGVDLVVVTADRPARLRGTSASQTTDQRRIFGDAVPFLDVAEPGELAGLPPGPVHLNVQFDGVLTPADRHVAAERSAGREDPAAGAADEPPTTLIGPGPRTVVVAGDDAGPPARILAERLGWPLLAEPSSGSRTGDAAIRCYRLLLGGALGGQVERVVVYGHPTLSRPVSRLLERAEVWAQHDPTRWGARPFPVARTFERLEPEGDATGADHDWRDSWMAEDRRVAVALDRLLAAEPELTPYEVAGAVSSALPAGGLLMVGASSPIRDLDLMVARYRVGDRRKVISNRGLAGIDGTVSAAVGAALGRPHSTRALALVGDVTFLHDSTGLFLGPAEERPDLTIVVVNDDGGSIFAMLEQGAPEYADRYDRLFGTPHGVDLASLCAAARVPHLRVGSLPELDQALASPNGGLEVVEVRVRRDNRRELDERIRALGTSGPVGPGG